MSVNSIAPCARFRTTVAPTVSRRIQRRLLSSSSSLQITTPESPRYIDVPKSLQTQDPPREPVKGVLPVPRQIVDKRREYKATPEWLEQTTQEPKRTIDINKVPAHLRERTIYRQHMAEMRRTSLRQGVSELYSRKVKTEQSGELARQKKVMKTLKAMYAPPRHDETWTDISVSKAIRDRLASKTEGQVYTAAEQAQKKAEADKIESRRVEDRLQSIHTLYLHAKDFITDESRLDEEIDRVFGSEENPMVWGGSQGKSVWNLKEPLGTKDMVGIGGAGASRQMPAHEEIKAINRMTKERLMRIAGKLTGGKIAVPENLDEPEDRYGAYVGNDRQ